MVRRALIVAGCLLVCLTVSATAQDADEGPRQATGRFASKDVDLEMWGAYAFEGLVGLSDKPGIRVAVSDHEFTDYADGYWDRKLFIDERFANGQAAIVYFHFSHAGEYQGMDYYFGGGNGCGYCFTSEVESSVKIRDNRIGGSLSFSDPEGATFDLSFDVPLAPTDYGKPLPTDGGEPARVYAAFHEALVSGDAEAIRPTLDARRQQFLPDPAFIAYMMESHPDTFELSEAYSKPDWALLIVEGEKEYYGKVRTEVHLIREEGKWVVEDELLKGIY